MNVVPFPKSVAGTASGSAQEVVQCVADILATLAASATKVQTLDLPPDLRRAVIGRMRNLAVEACAIGVSFSEDANLPTEYASKINEIGTRLQNAGARTV